MRAFVQIFVYMSTHVNIHIFINMNVYTVVRVCVCMPVSLYVPLFMCYRICMSTDHISICICILSVHACRYAYVCMRAFVQLCINVNPHKRVYTCVHGLYVHGHGSIISYMSIYIRDSIHALSVCMRLCVSVSKLCSAVNKPLRSQ